MIWASPPCTHFSVASIGKNWNLDGSPKIAGAKEAQQIVLKTLDVIRQLHPAIWFIENPCGMLRRMPFMQDLHGHTVSYCHYGDTRMKPTDIWTSALAWTPRPKCHVQRPDHPANCCCRDHAAAPRGSRTPGSTQGMKGPKDRGIIPPEFCIEIAEFCERELAGLPADTHGQQKLDLAA